MNPHELFVGVDVGGTNIKCGLVTNTGKVIIKRTVATEAEGGVNHVLNRIVRNVHELMDNIKGDMSVLALGVGLPGLVDNNRVILWEAPNLPGWYNVEAKIKLQDKFNIPVVLDNDANLAALGEYVYGAGQGVTEMMMVTLGTGVGGGLILRGEVYRGALGSAGEFGHTIIQKNGHLCICGRRGCLETYVGKYAILRQVRKKLESGRSSLLQRISQEIMTPKDVCHAALQGDEVALEVFREAGEYLGIGLGNVANLLNIQRVVVGGGLAKAGDLILEPARRALAYSSFKIAWENIDVVPAMLGEQAGLIGAATLAMQKCRSETT